nr:MAG: nonstructural protein [Microvirus sp.]
MSELKPTAILYFVFSIRDVKVNVYNTPFFQTSKAGAIRMFSDLCNDPQSTLAKHPEDFQLYEIGCFDSEIGYITSLDAPLFLSSATEFVSQP